jgi:acetyltransferase-like isoleucine patch superfamily enzyme
MSPFPKARSWWVRFRTLTTSIREWFESQWWRLQLLDRRVTLLPGCAITSCRRISVGTDVLVSHQCFFQGAGGISFGSRIMLGPRVMLITVGHDLTTRRSVLKPIRIEDGVWIGAGAIVLPGVVVGRESIVAAGAVVTRDVPERTVVAGVPARVVKNVDSSEYAGYFESASWRSQFGMRES